MIKTMKIIILITVSLLLIHLSGNAQISIHSNEFPGKHQLSISSDSTLTKNDLFGLKTLKKDTPVVRFDSLKTWKFKDIRPFVPGYKNPNINNNDIIVFNPGRNRDSMPNANVVTPGVYYHLEVIPQKNKNMSNLSGEFSGKHQLSIKSDSILAKKDPWLVYGLKTLKKDSSLLQFDSSKTWKFKGIRPFVPSRKNQSNNDIIVLNPGRSRDSMLNANVITPGVHYHLKIIPPKEQKEAHEMNLLQKTK
jgi:hypothetical protein